jgi:hypothetical protein
MAGCSWLNPTEVCSAAIDAGPKTLLPGAPREPWDVYGVGNQSDMAMGACDGRGGWEARKEGDERW